MEFKQILDLLKKATKSGAMGELGRPLRAGADILEHFFGSSTKPREKRDSELGLMFRTLIEKLDKLLDRLDSAFGPSPSKQIKDDFWASGKQQQVPKEGPIEQGKESWAKLDEILSRQTGNQGLRGMTQGLVRLGDAADKSKQADIPEVLPANGAVRGAATVESTAVKAGAADEAVAAGAGTIAFPIAAIFEILKLSKENMDVARVRIQEAGTNYMSAFRSESVTQAGEYAVGGVRKHVGALARATGGPISGAIAEHFVNNNPLLNFAETGFRAISFLREFSEQLIKVNLRFAEFSGAMAAVQAQFEVQNILLSQIHGQARATSTSQLAATQFRTERNLAPLEDAWSNIKSDVMTSFNELFNNTLGGIVSDLGIFLDQMREWGRKVAFWVDWDKKKREAEEAMGASRAAGERLRSLADRRFDWIRNGRQGPPPVS